MADFREPLDILNRAAQHCRVAGAGSLDEMSAQAVEFNRVYDKMRRYELRRNVWRFATRRVALRALSNGTSLLVPASYAAGTTYAAGAIVQYPASSGSYWISTRGANLGVTPGTVPTSGVLAWEGYYGPLTVEPFVSDTSYHAGELVYISPGDGTVSVYASLVEANEESPQVVDEWDSTLTYSSGAVVSYGSTNYQSRVNFNADYQPDESPTQWTSTLTNPAVSGSWLLVSATLSAVAINYPLTTGPLSVSGTRNAYRLPANYLREAPQAPKAGVWQSLGGPAGLEPDDYEFEGNYIVSSLYGPLVWRFVADVQDVTAFDPMFAEGLAAKCALECGPIWLPNRFTSFEQGIRRAYREIMGEARTVNGIETGPVDAPLDTYITCRA
jgi:hypothetical protein